MGCNNGNSNNGKKELKKTKRRNKLIKMVKNKKPGCCGEIMSPILRYKKNGYTYCTFECNRCHREEDVELSADNYEESIK